MKQTLRLFLWLAMAFMALQASAQMYIVGDGPFGGWNPAGGVSMTGRPDGTYTYTTTVSGKVYFVFADHLAASSDDWNTFNNNYRYGPKNGNQVVTVNGNWMTTQKSSSDAYYFTGNGSRYVFKFDTINKRFRVETEGEPINPITGHLYILGEAEGNTWDASTGVEMSTTDGHIFTSPT